METAARQQKITHLIKEIQPRNPPGKIEKQICQTIFETKVLLYIQYAHIGSFTGFKCQQCYDTRLRAIAQR